MQELIDRARDGRPWPRRSQRRRETIADLDEWIGRPRPRASVRASWNRHSGEINI